MLRLISCLLVFCLTANFAVADEKVAPTETPKKENFMILIDNRTPDEFREGHLNGAVLIPYDDPQFAEKVTAVAADKNTAIGLYCRSGRRSGLAREKMIKLGYTNVTNLGAKENAAKKAGVEIVK